MPAEIERLSDWDLRQLLSKLEQSVRMAIADGDAEAVGQLLTDYLWAHDEADRRFTVWMKRRAAPRPVPLFRLPATPLAVAQQAV